MRLLAKNTVVGTGFDLCWARELRRIRDATTRDVSGAPNVDLGYQAGKNWTVATSRRSTPTIALLANLSVKVAANGTDINCRECRSANCRRVRLVDERGGVAI